MINLLTTFFIGVVVGAVVGYAWGRRRVGAEVAAGENVVMRQAREKDGNLEKIRELLKTKNTLTNDDVQRLLGVSDATATRYLDELEKEGLIRQVGQTGGQTYYIKVK